MPGQRKAIKSMAERLGVDAQGLQQFVPDSPWSEEEMWRAIRQEIIPHLSPWRLGWWMKPVGSSRDPTR